MTLTGIHHVSILVSDMERAVAWYRDTLGLKEVPRPSNFTNPVRWFELGEDQVHLMPAREPDTISPRHFALHVSDCREAREHFRRRGVAVRETDPIAGADRFFITDPDGNNIEVIKWFRRWDENSERELGVPEGSGRQLAQQLAEDRRG